MKRIRNLFIAILTGTLVAGSIAGCGASAAGTESATEENTEKTTVTIGYLPITHALAVFEEKELLDANKDSDIQIELQKFSSWTDLMDALNAGQIDGASVLVELAMGAVSQGIDLQAVALGHKDGNVVIVSNDITSVEELKGKTFAIPSNQSSHNILLNDLLTNAGLSIDDVTVTQLAPSEMPSSLASGAIDGYCVAEPFGAQAVVQGFGHVLCDSTELWEDSICCALVFNGSYLKNNTEVVDEFIKSYYAAGESLDKEEATRIATDYLGQDAETLEQSLEWIHYDDLKITKEDYQVLVDKVVEYGINENPPTYEEFVYSGE